MSLSLFLYLISIICKFYHFEIFNIKSFHKMGFVYAIFIVISFYVITRIDTYTECSIN